MEVRNRHWITERLTDCLRAHNAAMVLALQSWMPSLTEIVDSFDVVTGPFAYVQLLGDRKGLEQITTTWKKIVLDKSEEIRRTVAAIIELANDVPVVTFVNNHYAGYAPATAEQLRGCLSES